jgi:plasmid stabilization system protein ParE
MKIIWSDFASETLKDIYDYYKEVANERVAGIIKENIFMATRQLINHPDSGQIEETLLQLEEGHRYLVNSNYKIVYKKVKEDILITDVFDTRQEPKKLNNPKRKPSRE